MKTLALVAAVTLIVSGCLKTRQQLRGERTEPVLQRQTLQQQKEQYREKAPPSAYRFEEIDEQMRQLNGRVDTLENQVSQLSATNSDRHENESKEQESQKQKFLAYEEALKKLESQITVLGQEVERLKTPAPSAVVGKNTSGTKSAYDEGEELFSSKKWREAIVSFQKYRDGNPKGKYYAAATFKIGVAFQELGMSDEARVFLEEVKDKFPKSKEAKKAAQRMKSLK